MSSLDRMSGARNLTNWVATLTLLLCPQLVRSADTTESLVIGERFSIYSKGLKESRNYLVHTPDRYDTGDRKYPVLIVLDASTQFVHTSAAVEFLAANQRVPQMIVVGIENANRGRDLSPPGAVPNSPGSSDAFLSFIADELLPEIDRAYRTHRYRVLVGHSLGGVFAVYSMAKRPDIFNAYLVINPYLVQDGEALGKDVESLLLRSNARLDFYMTMGNEGGAMHVSAQKLADVFAAKAPPAVRWRFEHRSNESHGSSPYGGVYEGLRTVFAGWWIDDPLVLFEQSGLMGLEDHYALVSERLGYRVNIPEATLQMVFNSLMQNKRYAEAESVVKTGLQLYSHRFVFNRLAVLLYSATQDQGRVIEYSTNVLKVFPGHAESRRTLEKLGVDVTQIVPEAMLSTNALASYLGRYAGRNATVEIAESEGRLYATTNDEHVELRAMSPSKFYGSNADVELTFRTDRRGKINGVLLDRFDTQYELSKIK